MMINSEVCSLRLFDIQKFLKFLKDNNIKVFSLKKINNYEIEFSTSIGGYKKIKKEYNNVVLKKRTGLYRILYNLISRKTPLLAILISLLTFYINTSLIYEVNVRGTSSYISNIIKEELINYGLRRYAKKPSFDKLLEYEKKLKETFYEYVEFLELRLSGVKLNCEYIKRRNSVILPSKTGPRYALKRGIISHFVVSSGQIMVKENQYVDEGTLLIDDKIITPSGDEIKIGVEGKVYAYTWTIVEVEGKLNNNNEIDMYQELIDRAASILKPNFTDEERIIEEKILKEQIIDNILYLKIHFTCLEDIAN